MCLYISVRQGVGVWGLERERVGDMGRDSFLVVSVIFPVKTSSGQAEARIMFIYYF